LACNSSYSTLSVERTQRPRSDCCASTAARTSSTRLDTDTEKLVERRRTDS